ncbi:DUF397 domain-containing protein [Actinomadura sp.]|uniref:DUF397 domain-containing protein n=1 Tax=Actinomadura sp. TaxID=1989 RepID=UPI0037CA0069
MDLNAAVWRKASRSNESGDACIEVASNDELVAIRDSKDSGGHKLILSHSDFRSFVHSLKSL